MVMRSSAALALVMSLALAACSDGAGNQVITDTETTTAGGANELALARCDELPDLTTAPESVVLSDDPEIADWQRSRAEFGLAADEASTRAVASDADHATPFGFPVSPEEEAAVFAAEETSSATAATVAELFAGDEAYGGHWIDSVHRAVVVLATTQDPAGWQARADAEIGGGTVRVIRVENSTTELQAARDAAVARLHELGVDPGSGDLLMKNTVSIFLEVLEPTLVAELAAVVPQGTVCVEGAEPEDVIPEGPQPPSGDGWRLLADEAGTGVPYATGFAASDSELTALWADIGLTSDVPAVDFDREVVVWFGPAVSGSCSDVRLDRVVFDEAAAVLSPVIVLPGGARSCTSDANAHAYVVAFERGRLPDHFTVSIGAPNEECCPDGTTEVDLGRAG